MQARPNPWPNASKKLLIHALLEIAEQYPDITYAEFFSDPKNIEKGYRRVTFKEFSNAVQAAAWWIKENVGPPKKDDGSETLVYIGPGDIRYGMLLLAGSMVGYKLLFPSPFYGIDAITELIETLNAKNIMFARPTKVVVEELLSDSSVRSYEVPVLEDFFGSTPQPYPYTKTFAEHKDEPVIALHTSGTTGLPKPIIWTHDWISSQVAICNAPASRGAEPISRWFCASPNRIMFAWAPHHATGTVCQPVETITQGGTLVYPPPANSLETGLQGVIAALDHLNKRAETKVDWLAVPAQYIEIMGSQPEILEQISSKITRITFGGIDVTSAAGNACAKKMEICPTIGSTEAGHWITLYNDAQTHPSIRSSSHGVNDWHYIHFSPIMNVHFETVSKTDEGVLGEMVMVRNTNEDELQPYFKAFPNETEYRPGDVFLQHSTKPHLWKYKGRIDDTIIFANGVGFHPTNMEERIAAHPGVQEAMIVGHKRPYAALILRLSEGVGLEPDIMQHVTEITSDVFDFVEVKKGRVLVVEKPFLRTPKGTLKKSAMLNLYADRLDEIYQKDAPAP